MQALSRDAEIARQQPHAVWILSVVGAIDHVTHARVYTAGLQIPRE